MRAFMSSTGDRGKRLFFAPAFEREAASVAVTEAENILAETEPAPIELFRHVRAGADAYPYETEAQGALAEALAAFVADEPTSDPYRIPGTTRPESRPTIRTEGRESDGPLFTQDRDARERAEARSQRRIF